MTNPRLHEILAEAVGHFDERANCFKGYGEEAYWRQLAADARALMSADEPTTDPAIVEQQLAEDERIFGSSFYRLVDGRKIRIPPQEVFFSFAKNRTEKPA